MSKRIKKDFDLRKNISLLVFFALLIINIFITPNFVSWITCANLIRQTNIIDILDQATIYGLMGLGIMLPIITGGIDISVGSAMALGAVISALGLLNGQWWLIAFSLLLTMGFGAIAGISISKFGVLPMVATLALRYIMRGMAKGVSGVGTVTFSSPALTDFFNMKLFDKIPIHLLILILAVVIVYILVNRMSFGGYIEAYGENSKAAGICGINAVKIILVCYCMSAAFSWMAGMLDMISVSSANPANIGTDYDVDAIAAVLVGGTPISGGHPNVMGTVGGAFVLQLINVMCNMHNIPYSISLMIKAVIIVLALSFHGMKNKSR